MAASSNNVSFDNDLLETKLFAPPWREGLVSRPRLARQLARATEARLTLISAPAGFGKSTLIAEWIASTPNIASSIGWVSLDQADNDPRTFWSYVFAALERVSPVIGAQARRVLATSELPPMSTVLAQLINDVVRFDGPVIFVLDDFHVIEDPSILEAIEFLIQRLPPRMHIIVAGRADPALPLGRLRGSGDVVEFRAADLRFTNDEAAVFLNDTMGLHLVHGDVAALESRTEGWITGLQLAALSLRGRPDATDFIQAFAGDDRYIVDYLIEEVLDRQPVEVREFLLRSSVLDRLCGPLCDALEGTGDGQAMLEALERENVFLSPLDDKRRWFRYHHLFADVLRAYALQEVPDQVPVWHRRASDWFHQNNLHIDAVRHVVAARDFNRAAELAELAWRPMDRSRRGSDWLRLARQLPTEQIQLRPVLCVAYAWALMEEGDLQAGPGWLQIAESRLSGSAATAQNADEAAEQTIVSDEKEFEHLSASIAAARAFHAMAIDDLDTAVDRARQSLDLLPEYEHERRAAPAALLAMAAWTRGDLDEAARSLEHSISSARQLQNSRFVITGSYVLGEILRSQGRIDAALATYRQALQTPGGQTDEPAASTADLHTGLAETYLMRNDLDAAERELARSKELGESAALPHWRHRWLVARAGLLEARGDLESALEALDEAALSFARGPVPEIRPIAAIRARLLIRSGKLDEVDEFTSGLPALSEHPARYVLEYSRLTLARQIIARRRETGASQFRDELFRLLDTLLDAALAQRRFASQVEILLLRALASDAHGAKPSAYAPLNQALQIAEPLGMTRIFLAEATPMRDLLRTYVASGESSPLLQQLWIAFQETGKPLTVAPATGDGIIIEPLTDRERDVLRLIATGMRNREIADELYISLSTVKRHIANAYGKLDVHTRTEAVARANELNLL